MNSLTKILALFIGLNIAHSISPEKVSAQPSGISFQVFYDQLSPYGEWVDDPDHGYIWLPNAGQDFTPYSTDGHWVYTDYGWTWVSDFEWGWAPFHYGRWDYDDYYGWYWVPGHEWGPAWVIWRHSDNYYGWAPMRPGISINISYGNDYYMPADRWIFVNERYIESPHIYRYYADRGTNVAIINRTTIINRTYEDRNRHVTYVTGPDRDEVQRVTGRSVRPVVIREDNHPGQRMGRGELRIYRPEVKRNEEHNQRPAPTKVVRSEEMRRAPEGNSNSRNRGEQNNYPRRQQNRQPSDQNLQERQTRTTAPAENNTHKDQRPADNNVRTQPTQNPTNNDSRRDQQTRTAAPANNNQPVQQNNTTPTDNRTRTQPETRREQPVQQNANPPERREQTRTVAPQTQNNNTRTAQPAQQPQQQQQQKAKPAERRAERKAKTEDEKKKDDSQDRRRN